MNIIKKSNIRLAVAKYINMLVLWITGGLFYFYLEIAFRNYSHYSMILCGGTCFLIVGMIGDYILEKEKNIIKALILIMYFGALTITTLELFTGIIVNIIFDMRVWNYSDMKYNVYGQICFYYTMLWALLSLLCVYVTRLMEECIFEINKPDLR